MTKFYTEQGQPCLLWFDVCIKFWCKGHWKRTCPVLLAPVFQCSFERIYQLNLVIEEIYVSRRVYFIEISKLQIYLGSGTFELLRYVTATVHHIVIVYTRGQQPTRRIRPPAWHQKRSLPLVLHVPFPGLHTTSQFLSSNMLDRNEERCQWIACFVTFPNGYAI